MSPVASTLRQLAVLGGPPAFPGGHPVPLIHPVGYRPKGDFSAVDAILANQENEDSAARPSQQRFVAKNLPGVGNPGPSYRATLQDRVGEFLDVDPVKTSVIAVSSGTVALRAVLKHIRGVNGDDGPGEVIVPQTTVGATVEAVIEEGFVPVFVRVDPHSWHLSPKATAEAITDRTAAIITVDWLGTQCDLRPFRNLADEHDVNLISDSAQSFGASNGKPPSVKFADATIYSLGYPKVLTGLGSGGLIICPEHVERAIKGDASGILRHEALAEPNAYMTLRALGSLPEALETRAAAGKLYRQRLAGIRGIAFQGVPAGLATNHYQVSFTVDAEKFGMSAKVLCQALRAENVHCSTDRMPCVASNVKFAHYGKVHGDRENSQRLATTSLTLPIANDIKLDTVNTICDSIGLIHSSAADVVKAVAEGGAPTGTSGPADVADLESKYRKYLIVHVLDDSSVHSKVFIPRDYPHERSTSVDELLARFRSRKQWSLGESVIDGELRVDAVVGTVVILGPQDAGELNPVALDESGSSATVVLVPQSDGTLVVRKSAIGYGIDGNGAPWLRRQSLFLSHSTAVKKTRMFVEPTKTEEALNHVSLLLPYIPSHSFGELAFANVGAQTLLDAIVNMFARMAKNVWTEDQVPAQPTFIKEAHFDRMRRRLEIARNEDSTLDRLLKQGTVTLNGRQLLGFEQVMKRLETHSVVAGIQPTILSEIHGDLNIHNVLSRLNPQPGDDPEALIDPRGVPLLSDDTGRGFERGDYCYDVSKMLFSVTGFSDIRKRLFSYSANGDSHNLTIKEHPGAETMSGLAKRLVWELAANTGMRQWIEKVEKGGVRAFELRVKVGEAAHFVADCACALGRNTEWEIVPLFLMGLEKLNDVVELLDGHGPLVTENPEPTSADLDRVPPAGADFGVVKIQNTLFQSLASLDNWPYDVLELSVKVESAATFKALLRGMVGTYLPKETAVYVSTDPVEAPDHHRFFPCVLIHPSNGVRGQTHMLAAATRRTSAFFRDNGIPQEDVDGLRIVHISSTGSSSRSQFMARDNDKLLSPGTFGISPLTLAVLQTTQLPFPKPGRWVVENDSFFLLGRPLEMSGNDLCLLAIKRPTSGSTSSWRVCIDEVEDRGGRTLAKSFRNIEDHEKGQTLLRTTTGLFLPHRLAKAIGGREDDYATRTSPLLIDIVLPRFMEKKEWIQLSHKQSYGVNSHRVWENAQSFQADVSGPVELANGGEGMAFYHYGSDKEYRKLLADVSSDTRLNSLAYAGAAVQWLHKSGARGEDLDTAMTD
ncbi:hypothetical protein EDB92DRAFT_1904988 [Lactarius akahatsu]|uniref:Uncharacterized protein n=1 Tax=Lactarius akahatsu TaxID=416441 RepID=A0AAD4L8D5_9AGAM|nr:hypothetical protein EDB92DRAFT_1904988 [Lactarius akahatsu]